MPSQLAADRIRGLEYQRTIVAFTDTNRIAAAKIAFIGNFGRVLFDHTVRTGIDAVAATGAFPAFDNDNAPLVYKYRSRLTGFHAIRLGTLKADAGNSISFQGKIIYG